MDECPQFCKNCPMIPQGVTAVLTAAQVITMTELRRFRFAHLAPEVAEMFVNQTRIEATIISSTLPNVDKGDKEQMVVPAEGEGFNELKLRVESCKGPVSVNLLQRLFRVRTRCGAIDNRRITSM